MPPYLIVVSTNEEEGLLYRLTGLSWVAACGAPGTMGIVKVTFGDIEILT